MITEIIIYWKNVIHFKYIYYNELCRLSQTFQTSKTV